MSGPATLAAPPQTRRRPTPATPPDPLRLRRLPVPATEPPFAEEPPVSATRYPPADPTPGTGREGSAGIVSLASGAAARQAGEQPALDLDFPTGRPWPAEVVGTDAPAGTPGIGPVPRTLERARSGLDMAPGPGADDEVAGGPGHERLPPPPEPRTWTLRLLQGALEVLSGTRPPQQLVRWCSEPVYADLVGRGRVRGGPPGRAQVHSLRTTSPRAGVVEAAAVFTIGGRVRALAARLEWTNGRWRATVLDLL